MSRTMWLITAETKDSVIGYIESDYEVSQRSVELMRKDSHLPKDCRLNVFRLSLKGDKIFARRMEVINGPGK